MTTTGYIDPENQRALDLAERLGSTRVTGPPKAIRLTAAVVLVVLRSVGAGDSRRLPDLVDKTRI